MMALIYHISAVWPWFQTTAALREHAKKKRKELQDFEKLNKAHNMKTSAARVFNLVSWCSTSDIKLVGLDLPAYFGLRQIR